MSETGQSAEAAILDRFNEAFNRHDVDAIMSLMTPDCVFENTYPPPDGTRYEGQAAVRGYWVEFFQSSPNAHFEVEDVFFGEHRAAQTWVYNWRDEAGSDGHIRGVDIFRFRDGLVAEKLSYVKG